MDDPGGDPSASPGSGRADQGDRRVVRDLADTVRKALAAAGAPSYRRVAKGSIVDAVEPRIRVLLARRR